MICPRIHHENKINFYTVTNRHKINIKLVFSMEDFYKLSSRRQPLITRQLYSHSLLIVNVYTQSGAQHSQKFSRDNGMSFDIAGLELPCRTIFLLAGLS